MVDAVPAVWSVVRFMVTLHTVYLVVGLFLLAHVWVLAATTRVVFDAVRRRLSRT